LSDGDKSSNYVDSRIVVVAGSMEDPVTLSSRTIRGMTAAQNNLWADTGGVNVNKLDGLANSFACVFSSNNFGVSSS
jgi:hypothetical protein